jgi:phosphatidylinositol alpha-1,6-mannosyltransferase
VFRALHVVHQYPPAVGGCETLMQRLTEGVADAAAAIAVLTSTSRGLEFLGARGTLPAGREHRGGVVVDRLVSSAPPRLVRRALYALAQTWSRPGLPGYGRLRALAVGPHLRGLVDRGERFRPSIVLAASAPFLTLWQAERVARRSGAALVLLPCLHADPQIDHPSLLHLLRRADAVLTLTDYESAYLTSLGVAGDRLHRVGGGVDPRAATPNGDLNLRQRFGLRDDDPIVLYAGRQSEGKGIETLIASMTLLWSRGSPAVLVIAGATTPRTAEVRRAATSLDPVQRARIVFRDDIGEAEKWAWYRECTVMAAPSSVDSLGLCYLEAWSCARPVVAARTGPQSELVKSGRDGLLVTPGDAGELARALETLLADRQRASAMGERGREVVSAEHTWDRVVARLRAVYARLAPETA